MGKEITSLINTVAIERNRYHYYSTLIDILAFLATHQSAFRRKIDAFESEDEGEMDSFSVYLIILLKNANVYVQSIKLSHEMRRTPVPICKTNLLL